VVSSFVADRLSGRYKSKNCYLHFQQTPHHFPAVTSGAVLSSEELKIFILDIATPSAGDELVGVEAISQRRLGSGAIPLRWQWRVDPPTSLLHRPVGLIGARLRRVEVIERDPREIITGARGGSITTSSPTQLALAKDSKGIEPEVEHLRTASVDGVVEDGNRPEERNKDSPTCQWNPPSRCFRDRQRTLESSRL
jgi:hypothetical protein